MPDSELRDRVTRLEARLAFTDATLARLEALDRSLTALLPRLEADLARADERADATTKRLDTDHEPRLREVERSALRITVTASVITGVICALLPLLFRLLS